MKIYSLLFLYIGIVFFTGCIENQVQNKSLLKDIISGENLVLYKIYSSGNIYRLSINNTGSAISKPISINIYHSESDQKILVYSFKLEEMNPGSSTSKETNISINQFSTGSIYVCFDGENNYKPYTDQCKSFDLNDLNCGSISNNSKESRTRYVSPQVEFGQSCVSEVQRRSCSNGVLSSWSGSYIYDECVVADQVVVGCGELSNGQTESRTRYASAKVEYGKSCVSEVQTRSCSSGALSSWSGSYSFDNCHVGSSPASFEFLSFSSDSTSINLNGGLTTNFSIKNVGDIPSNTASITFFLSTDNLKSPDNDKYLAGQSFTIGSNQTFSGSYTIQNFKDIGNYYIYGCLTPSIATPDYSKYCSSMVSLSVLPEKKANLIIESMAPTKKIFSPQEFISFNVNIKNIGTADSSSTFFYIKQVNINDNPTVVQKNIGSIPAGQSSIFTIELNDKLVENDYSFYGQIATFTAESSSQDNISSSLKVLVQDNTPIVFENWDPVIQGVQIVSTPSQQYNVSQLPLELAAVKEDISYEWGVYGIDNIDNSNFKIVPNGNFAEIDWSTQNRYGLFVNIKYKNLEKEISKEIIVENSPDAKLSIKSFSFTDGSTEMIPEFYSGNQMFQIKAEIDHNYQFSIFASYNVKIYHSMDNNLSFTNDELISDSYNQEGLDPGANKSFSFKRFLPEEVGIHYYFICVGLVGQEEYNCSSHSIKINMRPMPNPILKSITVNGKSGEVNLTNVSDANFLITANVVNDGDIATTEDVIINYYRSTDDEYFSPENDELYGSRNVSILEAGESGGWGYTFPKPTTPGTYYYGACVTTAGLDKFRTDNCSPVNPIKVIID